MTAHSEVDVVIVGMGWVGSIMAASLTSVGLSVVGLERGPDRRGDDPAFTRAHDELRFQQRQDLVQDTARETWTFRHGLDELALPLRYAGAFRPGEQVGGSGLTWGGASWRLPPSEFALRSTIRGRYGDQALPEHSNVMDWPWSYDDLEPYYRRFEEMAGVAGQAGNLRGVLQRGGNPFEGARSSDYPLPPHADSLTSALFVETTRSLGLSPFPVPNASVTAPYMNRDGVRRGACTYCGFCRGHACQVGAKASPLSTVLPIAEASGCFELRANAHVVEILHSSQVADAVRYVDDAGAEHLQPAGVVVVAAFTLSSLRLLLLSKLGVPYDPVAGTGTVGKNYCSQTISGGVGFFGDRTFNRHIGSSGGGAAVADYSDDNFDHSGLGFVGGGFLSAVAPGAAPIEGIAVPPGTPRWGVSWKRAARQWYDGSLPTQLSAQNFAYRDNYLDLDPTYRDRFGLPLLRITFNWKPNDRRAARFLGGKLAEIYRAMGADKFVVRELDEYFDTVRYGSTHNSGGAIMGTDPDTSTVNKYMQMWDCPNVFVVGGSAMPQNPAYPPTATVGALAYVAAEAIAQRYIERPGVLV